MINKLISLIIIISIVTLLKAANAKTNYKFSSSVLKRDEKLGSQSETLSNGRVLSHIDNDYIFSTARLNLKSTSIGQTKRDTFIFDAKWKYIFFGHISFNDTPIVEENRYIVRKFFYKKYISDSNYNVKFGRFLLDGAAGSYLDGLKLERSKRNFKYNIWYGLNPESSNKSNLAFNKDSIQAGGGFSYLKANSYEFFEAISGIVFQDSSNYKLKTSYIHNYTNYNNKYNKFYSSVKYHLVPENRISQVNLYYTRKSIYNEADISVKALKLDFVDNYKQKDIRDQLPSSEYKEGQVILIKNFRYPNISLKYKYGKRRLDGLEKKMSSLLTEYGKNNFVFNSTFSGGRYFDRKSLSFTQTLCYNSASWETFFSGLLSRERYDSNELIYAFSGEASFSRSFLNEQLFAETSYEFTKDYKSTIQVYIFRLVLKG